MLAWSSLTLLRMVQGSDLEWRHLACDQVLKFIRTIRASGRHPVAFIGISRTGLTSDMVRRISRAIALLPLISAVVICATARSLPAAPPPPEAKGPVGFARAAQEASSSLDATGMARLTRAAPEAPSSSQATGMARLT